MHRIPAGLALLTRITHMETEDGRWCRVAIAEMEGTWQVWESVCLGAGQEPSAALLAVVKTPDAAKREHDRVVRARRRFGFRKPEWINPLAALSSQYQPVIDELKAWRKQEADRQGVRPHEVLRDAHLAEVIKRWPDSPDDLLLCVGWGAVRLTKYGQAVLDILAKHKSAEVRGAV